MKQVQERGGGGGVFYESVDQKKTIKGKRQTRRSKEKKGQLSVLLSLKKNERGTQTHK